MLMLASLIMILPLVGGLFTWHAQDTIMLMLASLIMMLPLVGGFVLSAFGLYESSQSNFS
jgi:hypothetical protein